MKQRMVRLLTAISLLSAVVVPTHAHNLDTLATSISFENEYLETMSQRASVNQQLIQVGDEFWVMSKTTPGPGTQTGVGGYQTFYVPPGMEVVDAAYVLPDPSDPRGFRNISMKGQSSIAIGNGSIAQSSTPELFGYTFPGVNGLGFKSEPVTGAGKDRGTLAGVYADTGIFFSTDPRTVFNSYSGSTMTNNAGDTVGEQFAANIANAQQRNVLGVMNLWDSYQLSAYGRADVSPIVDGTDGRGNAPWGLANAVAGPQSGYAWEFDYAAFQSTSGTTTQKMRAAIKLGPWNRVQYPGSQISKDQPGTISNVLGQVGIDASLMGVPSTSIPANTNAIRVSLGQLELGRPEHSAVKLRVVSELATSGCSPIYADAFGGDAGGTDGGKDHIWRYFDPTVISLSPCTFLQKVASKSLVSINEQFYYDITFANNGSVALPNVTIVDTLPSALQHVKAKPQPSVEASPNFTWNLGTVQPGQIITIRHNVRALSEGTHVNTATAKSDNVTIGIAQQTVEVNNRALLIKSKTVTPTNAVPGETVTYTLEVENIGTGKNGTPMVLRDTLPPGFTYHSFVGATLGKASISSPTITVNASNPTKPSFTVTKAIDPGKSLLISFKALIGLNVQPGRYDNQFQVEYEDKILPPIPEAPVYVSAGKIGDTVWRDWNGNGIQDPGELGISGVTVQLYAADGTTLLATATTDSNGNYYFPGLAESTYVVKVVPPAGSTQTGDPDAVIDNQHSIVLGEGEQYLTADFGYQPGGTGTIGDQVFEDLNKNGVWNDGEVGIPNVTVELFFDSNGNRTIDSGDLLTATTATNGSGIYSFTGLDTSLAYLVRVSAQDPDISTYFTTLYGDAAAELISINPYPVAAGFTNVTLADFGFWRTLPASIGDQVFIDNNLNGIYDAGDAPLGNITVGLYDQTGTVLLFTTTSDPQGIYTFGGLPAGSFVVKVDSADSDVPAGFTASVASYNVTVAAGDVFLTADFPFITVFSKSVDLASAAPGDFLNYTMYPYWPGPSLLTDARVTDSVPAGTNFVSAGQGGILGENSVVSTPGVPGSHPGSTGSGTATLTAVKDTYLNSAAAGTNYGASTSLIENRGGGNTLGTRQILAQFDLTTLPTGATLTGAQFKLTKTSSNNPNVPFQIYPLLKAWDEGSGGAAGTAGAASLNLRVSGTYWGGGTTPFDSLEPSADFGSLLAATTVGAAATYTWTAAALLTQVQTWYATPATNLGLVMGSSGSGTDDTVWNSRESAGTKPQLVVDYTATASPATTTTITASPSTVTDTGSGVNVTVSMNVTASSAVSGIAPTALTVIPGALGANATYVSGPTNSPASGTSATFTWVYNVTGGTANDQVKFSGSATGTGATFASATSNGVVVNIPDPDDNIVTWNLGSNTPAVNGSHPGTGGSVNTTITSSKATYNYVDLPTRNYGGDAIIGLDADAAYRCNSFVEFNLSSIPTGATITSASLRLVHSSLAWGTGSTEIGNPFTTGIRRVTRGWVEGTAVHAPQAGSLTWASAGPANWTTAGGDYSATDYGSFIGGAPDAPGTVYSVNVLTLVNEWYQGTQTNNGLALVPLTDTSGEDYYTMYGDEATDPNNRPQLLVTYTLAPTAATTTSVSVLPALVTASAGGVNVNVSMTVTATAAVTNITAPTNLTIAGTHGASATQVSGPTNSPVSIGAGGSATFTWVYNVTAGSTPGQVTFGGTPTGTGATFAPATSNGVIVTQPLTMQVQIISPDPGVPLVNNVAEFFNGPDFIAQDNAITSLSASIGDFVWLDADGDGIQDAGEFGIGGVTVNVYSADGLTLLGSAVTDGFGSYRVFGLAAGDYLVSYDLASAPAGYFGTTPAFLPVTLAESQQFSDADFGLNVLPPGTGSIGDYVWMDSNNDGIQDAGEMGIPGVAVQLEKLVNGNWVQVATTTTDSAGLYTFAGLSGGEYRVTIDSASQITSPYAQGSFALGAVTAPTYDADGTATPNVALVTLATDSTVIDTTDFGYNWSGSIGDFVWWDDDANGAQDESPLEGIEGARVQLYFDADFDGVFNRILGDYEILRVFTDANGGYLIPNLPPGNYYVDVYEDSIATGGLRNIVPTTDDLVQANLLPGNMNIDTADFGYFEGARIEALVFWDANQDGIVDFDESLLENITVTLTGTDSLGKPVTRTLQSSPDGYVVFLVPEGDYTISYATPEVAAEYPALSTPTTLTSFVFTALPGDDNIRKFVFGVDNSGAIGDTIFSDINGDGFQSSGEPALAGVTVNLYLDANGDGIIDLNQGDLLLDISATDENGNYLFTGLEDTAGNSLYLVEVLTSTLPEGYQAVPTAFPVGADTVASTYSTALINGESIEIVDFGYPLVPANYYTLSGTIYHDSGAGGGTSGDGAINGAEPGLEAVRVLVSVDADNDGIFEQSYVIIADANGFYSIGGILQGSDVRVTVVETTLPNSAFVQTGDPDGGTLSASWLTTGVQANVTDVDFGYLESLGSITGTVVQGDGNGTADISELVIEGVTVTAYYSGPDGIPGNEDDEVFVTTTDSNGNYSFEGLLPGDYEIVTTIPAPYHDLADADGFNPNSIDVSLATGQDVVNRDFEYQVGLISGVIWTDNNVDGIRQIGEPLISGARVFLDLDGNGTLDAGEPSTTTDGNGFYQFPNLVEGTYQVRVDATTLPAGSIQSFDLDGLGTPNVATVTLAPNGVITGVDFGYYQNGSIAGVITIDTGVDKVGDVPQAGVIVQLLDGNGVPVLDGTNNPITTTTNETGAYLFENLPPGDYQVRQIVPENFEAVNDVDDGDLTFNGDTTPISVGSGSNVTGQDFVNSQVAEIAGNVFNDLDGLDDDTVDGAGTNAGGIYVNLVDPSDNIVIASIPVNADGTYLFTPENGVEINSSYRLILTTQPVIVGQVLTASTLPLPWYATGENLGAGVGDDGAVNGILTVTTTVGTVAQANFGIQEVPDVTPVITATPNIMNGPTEFTLRMRIAELNNVDTKGPIVFRVPKDFRWTLREAYDENLVTLDGFPMDNNLWTYSENPDFHIFTSKENVIIAAGSFYTVGIKARWQTANQVGIYTISINIDSGSGSENRINNNSDAERLLFFNN